MKKALNAALLLVLGTLLVAVEDGSISTWEWVFIAVAALRGVLAFGVRPELGKFGVYLPLVVTGLVGALSQLGTVLQDGGTISLYEGVSAAIVFVSAMTSTYVTPDAKISDALVPTVDAPPVRLPYVE